MGADLSAALARVRATDWENLADVDRASGALLELVADHPDLLAQLLAMAREVAPLREMCESYDILDKVVLLNDAEAGYRLRLHVFRPGYFDRPHNHRWTYTSRILRGSYQHTLYAADGADELRPGTIRPFLVRQEIAGSAYTLHHSMVHAAVAEPWTISLILRGPAVKDEFTVMDQVTGEVWAQRGAAQETADERATKRMTDERYAEVERLLVANGLLDGTA